MAGLSGGTLEGVETQTMTPRSITHRILQVALAIAVLIQSAFVTPAGACGVNGSCCSELSTSQQSEGCCCEAKNGQDGARVHSCCHSAETVDSTIEVSACCHAGESSTRCTCHCGQPQPTPVVPPADADTQIRLIPVSAYLVAAAIPAPATAAPTGWNDRQSSLLKTAPRSVQVLFCTWQT